MGELEDSVQVTEDSFKARVEELVQEFDVLLMPILVCISMIFG